MEKKLKKYLVLIKRSNKLSSLSQTSSLNSSKIRAYCYFYQKNSNSILLKWSKALNQNSNIQAELGPR